MDPPAVEILAGALPRGGSLGVYLGSFDPPHRGHGWIVDVVLERFDSLLLLLPATHFHKVIAPPRHATLAQRRVMLNALMARAPSRVSIGLAREVLFLRLDQALARAAPGLRIGFAMGDETHARLLNSAAYFARVGRSWGPGDDQALADLARRVLTFDRSGRCPTGLRVPAPVRELSSTLVRREAAMLHREGASRARFLRRLGPWLPDGVADFIANERLYTEA